MSLLEQATPKMEEACNNDVNGLPKRLNHYFVRINSPSPDIVHRDLGIPVLGSPEFDALIDLLKDPWFFRAWTWQENFLAKESKFFRGSWSWSGQLIRRVCSVLCNLSTAYGSENEFLPGYYTALSMTTGLDFWIGSAESPKTYVRLFALLILRRGSDCACPSDLVYSLLGAAWESSNIEIDYQQPFEIAFAKSAWKITIQRANFDPIRSGKRPIVFGVTYVGSRLAYKRADKSSLEENFRYAATGSSRPVGSLSDDAKVLTVIGLNWDRIYSAKNALYAKIDQWVNSVLATVVDDNDFYTPTNESLERALRRVRYSYKDETRNTTEDELTRWKPNSHEEFEAIV